MKFRTAAFSGLALFAGALGTMSCGGSSQVIDYAGGGATGAGADGGAGGMGGTGVASCPPPTSTVCVAPAPSFAADITPILNRSCNTAACHAPGNPTGQWPLDDYTDVNDWVGLITPDLLDCSMPPADSGTSFPDSDRQLIFAWIACGSPNN